MSTEVAKLQAVFEGRSEQLQKQLRTIESKLDAFTKSTKKISGGFKQAKEQSKKELQGLEKEVSSAGKRIKESLIANFAVGNIIGNFATRAINGIGGTIRGTINEFANFEKKISEVGATFGADPFQLEQIRIKSKILGETTEFTAEQSAGAFEKMALAGWSVDNSLKAVGSSLSLASATSTDLVTASDILTDQMSAFNIKASQSEGFVNALTNTTLKSNTNLYQLGESLTYVAANAYTSKMSVEETSAAIGILSNNGIKASMAGTGLSAILSRISVKTKTNAKAFNILGISLKELYDSNGAFMGAGNALAKIKEKYDHLSEAQQKQIGYYLAGQENLKSFNVLMSNLGDKTDKTTKSFFGLNNYLKETNITAKEIAEKKLDNLAGDFTKLTSALSGFKIAMAGDSNGLLRDFTQGLTKLTQATTKYKNVIFPAITAIGALTAGIYAMNKASVVFTRTNALVLGITAITIASFYLIKNWDSLSYNTQSLIKLFGIFAGTIGVVVGIVKVARMAQLAWNVAMVANPVGAVIVGVIALGTAIFALARNWDFITKFTKTALNKIILEIESAIFQLVSSFTNKFPSIAELMGLDSKQVQNSFGQIQRELVIADGKFNDVTSKIKNAGKDMVKDVKNAVAGLTNINKNGNSNPFEGLAKASKETALKTNKNFDTIKAKISEVEDKFKGYQDLVKEKTKAQVELQKTIDKALDSTKNKYLDIAKSLKEDVIKAQEDYRDKVKEIQEDERKEIKKTKEEYAKSIAERLTELDKNAGKEIDKLGETQEKEKAKAVENEKKKQELLRKVAKDFGVMPSEDGGILSDQQLKDVEYKLNKINNIKTESQRKAKEEYDEIIKQNQALQDQIDKRQEILDSIKDEKEELTERERNQAIDELNKLLQNKSILEAKN
ncbi:MAG: phage tail tape measure protein, partial [Deltaproteobacteria bacterium]|nr:phage tail tape measure protein [Deltaproteobacteria bacterium]